MVAKWKTAGLVFLLALTMSTAVLAAGGIGVSELARPVSQVPPAPDVSPFRVVAGVPVTEDPFAAVPAPVVAPREVRAQEAAGVIEADEAQVATARGRRAGPAAVPAPVPPAVRPAPAPAPNRQVAPRPAPSGSGEQPAEPRPAPPVKEAPEQGETAQPDAAPADDDERLRAADADDDDERKRRNRNNGNSQPKPQDHKHRAPESRQAQSNGNSQGQPEGQSQPQSAGGGQSGGQSGGQPGGSQKH